MVGLTSLEVYSSIFKLTEKSFRFELYIFPDSKKGWFTNEKVRDEIEKNLEVSDITATELQDELLGPNNIEKYRKEVSKRMKTNKYMDILDSYTTSIFREFESFLRTEVDLVQDDFRLVLNECNLNFITFELPSGFYIFKDLSDFILRDFQSKFKEVDRAIVIEFHGFSMTAKLLVRPGLIAIRFEEKSFFISILGFNPHWDYKFYKEYIRRKIPKISTKDKFHIECDVIDSYVLIGKQEPYLLFYFRQTSRL